MDTRGGKREEIQLYLWPVKPEKWPCHAAEVLARRPTDYEERTPSHISQRCIFFYWFTIRQIIRQSTCNPDARQDKNPHVLILTLLSPEVSVLWGACLQTWQWTLKSNLFIRQEQREIDVHISSINGFYNSPAWWTGASQSSSSKLCQVHSRFSRLIDNQISAASVSRGTLWSEPTFVSGGSWEEKVAPTATDRANAARAATAVMLRLRDTCR